MNTQAYCLFETAIGCCGIAWEPANDTNRPTTSRLQLPEATLALTAEKIAADSGGKQTGDIPPDISQVIEKVCAHFAGQLQDFQNIPLLFAQTGDFSRQVYEITRQIPAGQTLTYGDIAKALQKPFAARAVGQALGRNPIALLIPCHRVLAAGGKAGGFTAHGGLATKTQMLALEGITI